MPNEDIDLANMSDEFITKAEASRRMYQADRDRARIAYAGTRGLYGAAEAARERKNKQTPEYAEAQERFTRYSRMVGNDGPADLKAFFRMGSKRSKP